MRYLCVHCDHRFDHEGDDKPRCPKCMRLHGLEKVAGAGTSGASASRRPRWIVPAVLATVVVGLGAAYFLWAREAPAAVGDTVAVEPLDSGELRGHLRRLGADAERYVTYLEP